jgi:hypothetical protein
MISTTTNPQFQIRQTNLNDFARIRLQTGAARFFDIAAFNGASASADRLNMFHSTAGDILTISGTGRVGIGNTNPNAPLAFAAALGKKITLYPGGSGDAGFGMAGNRLQIFGDNPNADIALGYDVGGVFNERFAFKPTGAMAVNGNVGAYGNLLTSGGTGSALWTSVSSIIRPIIMPEVTYVIPSNFNNAIPGATITFTLPVAGKLILNVQTTTTLICTNLLGPCDLVWQLKPYLNNNEIKTWFIQAQTQVTQPDDDHSLGPLVLNLPAGTHTIRFNEVLVTVAFPPTIRVSAAGIFIPD